MQNLQWQERYTYISSIKYELCPVCHGQGNYSKREHENFFWVLFQCKNCGYEIREHVVKQRDEESLLQQEAVQVVELPLGVSVEEARATMTPAQFAQLLIEKGYTQMSRKYRLLARLPEGKTGVEALKEVDPILAQRFLNNAEQMCKSQFLVCYADKAKTQIELTREEFNAYLTATGRSPSPQEV